MNLPCWTMALVLAMGTAGAACASDSSRTGSGSAICDGPECEPLAEQPLAPPPECMTAQDCGPEQACTQGYCLGAECAIADDAAPCPESCTICVHAGP